MVKDLPASAGDAGDVGSVLGSGRSPGGGGKASTAVSLPGKSHGQQSLADYRPWDQSQTQLSE